MDFRIFTFLARAFPFPRLPPCFSCGDNDPLTPPASSPSRSEAEPQLPFFFAAPLLVRPNWLRCSRLHDTSTFLHCEAAEVEASNSSPTWFFAKAYKASTPSITVDFVDSERIRGTNSRSWRSKKQLLQITLNCPCETQLWTSSEPAGLSTLPQSRQVISLKDIYQALEELLAPLQANATLSHVKTIG